MRPSELRAKEGFAAWLNHVTGETGVWEDGKDPPDHWLEWDQERFAVEITEVMQDIPLGQGFSTERGVREALKRTAAKLEAELLAEGSLNGTYVLHACPVPELGRHLPTLKATIRKYVVNTGHLATAPSKQLLKGRRGQAWSISKLRATGAALLAWFSVGSAKWSREATEDLRSLIEERVRVKSEDYRAIPGRKILLLVDSYLYADWEDWIAAASVQFEATFHTVAVISSTFGCRVLHSENKAWAGAA